jgi:pimeloyl-ACP methyl ester carboxylesterase
MDLSSADELRVPSATGELFAYRTGDPDGRRVIFLHGTPGSADAYAEYLMEPLPGFEYLSVDRPGHGHSEPTRAVADLERQAAAVAAVLPAAGDPAILVGHSYGAPVAAWLASTQPDRVAGLVLIAGSVAPEHEKRRWYNWVAGGIDWLLPHEMAVANDEIWPLKAQLEELAELAPGYTGDLVVIHGTEDGLVPYANATWAMDHFSGARSKRLVTIEGEGHFILWSHRSEIEAELEGLR